MPKIDLREYKKEIRSQMRRIRREMSPQTVQEKNDRIYKRLIATQQYRRAKTVVVYVSKELEVDTRRLMEHAPDWQHGGPGEGSLWHPGAIQQSAGAGGYH